MAAPKGNNYWQFRDKHGRDFKYRPEALWDEFVQYSEWLTDNPLYEEKQFAFQGVVTIHDAPKMRAMTLTGFCLFADISLDTFQEYRKNKDFIAVCTRIDNAIYQQKFEGAAADLLNPSIIARDLGLKDNVNHLNNGDDFKATSITVSTSDHKETVNALLKKFESEDE